MTARPIRAGHDTQGVATVAAAAGGQRGGRGEGWFCCVWPPGVGHLGERPSCNCQAFVVARVVRVRHSCALHIRLLGTAALDRQRIAPNNENVQRFGPTARRSCSARAASCLRRIMYPVGQRKSLLQRLVSGGLFAFSSATHRHGDRTSLAADVDAASLAPRSSLLTSRVCDSPFLLCRLLGPGLPSGLPPSCIRIQQLWFPVLNTDWLCCCCWVPTSHLSSSGFVFILMLGGSLMYQLFWPTLKLAQDSYSPR